MMNLTSGKGNHHAVFSPSVKEQEMYHPVPQTSTNPFGFENMPPSVNEPQSLVDDHPLMVEMAELKAVREKRRMYWAGLSEQIGEEWDNPMSYDRQRWKTEEALADKKFQELSGQIALAERGILVTDVPTNMEPKQAAQGYFVSPAVPSGPRGWNARRGRAIRRPTWKLEARPVEIQTELKSSSISNLVRSCQEVDRPRPASRRRDYKDDKQAEVVSKWMDDVGLHFDPHNPAPPPIAIGTSDDSIHIESEEMYSVDQEALFMSDDQNNTPYGPRKRFRDAEYSSSPIELGRQSRKTTEDEIVLEVAESRREAQRSRMALATVTERRDIMTGGRLVLKNPRLATSSSNVNTLVINTQVVKRMNETEDAMEDIRRASVDINTSNSPNHKKQQSISEFKYSTERHQELPHTDACDQEKDTSNISNEIMTQISQVDNAKQPEISNQPKDIFDAVLESLEKPSVPGVSVSEQLVSSTNQPILVTSASPTPTKRSEFMSRFFNKKSNLPQALAAAALRNLQAKSQESSARMESVKTKTPNLQPQLGKSTSSQMLNMDGAQDMMVEEVPAIKKESELDVVDLLRADSLLTAATERKPSKPTKHKEDITALPRGDDEPNSNRHSKAADWMDIDHPSSIEVVDLQDAPNSESEHDIHASSTTATSSSPQLPRYIRRVATRRVVEEAREMDDGDDLEDSEYETSSEASSDLSTLESSSPRRLPLDTRDLPLRQRASEVWISPSQVYPFPPQPVRKRVMYIGNLAFSTTFEDLHCLLKRWHVYVPFRFPSIPLNLTDIATNREQICLAKAPNAKHHSGYAFAIMTTEAEMETAIEESGTYVIDDRAVLFRRGKLPEAQRIACEEEMARWVEEETVRRERSRVRGQQRDEAARASEKMAARKARWDGWEDVVEDERQSRSRQRKERREERGTNLEVDEMIVVAVEAKLNDLSIVRMGLSEEEKFLHRVYLEREMKLLMRLERRKGLLPRELERGQRIRCYLDELESEVVRL